MDRISGNWRLRAAMLATACALALSAAPAPASVYTSAVQSAGAVWTSYPGGYYLISLDPLRSNDGASGAMSYWLQGVVNSWFCDTGSYANVYAQGSLQIYAVTPTSATGTIEGTAYDSCAGFDRDFEATVNLTDNGPPEAQTDCCKLGYNYLVVQRWQYNGPGTATFQWEPVFADTDDFTSMGATYNNAAITTDLVASAP